MNYELAKKLKDAGFPLVHSSTQRCWRQICGMEYDEPSLSELIEVCGNVNMTLVQCGSHWDIRWFNDDSDNEQEILNSATPEEAVAELWLALHKKI